MTKKLFEEGLTKDQLFDIMSSLPEDLLADIQWAAEVELMDRAFRTSVSETTKDQCLSV